jgi:hypothetical protein
MRRALLLPFVVGCWHNPTPVPLPPEPRGASPLSMNMDTFEMNGFTLVGAEYWPYVGKEDIRYPEDVLWGFYPVKGEIPPGEEEPNPDSATPAAIMCAETAFEALQVYLASNPPELRQVVERGAAAGFVPRFYLWTNDYTRAADPYPPGMREARLWYWHRKEPSPPKPPGYWKWEATVNQRGECQIPNRAQSESYLRETLGKL